ncbi:MAG TPA: hypothetical protein VGE35_00735 [Candidatus Paceibacterota bacterium]
MENNTHQNAFTQANPASAPASVAPASGKSSFWKGVAVGAVGIVVLMILVSILAAGFAYSRVQPALNNAQIKGNLAAVRANLSNLRAEAEVYYDRNNGSYAGVCRSDNFDATLNSIVSPIALNGDVMCAANAQEYIAAATVQDVDGIRMVCVDSTGAATSNFGRAKDHFAAEKMTCN